MMNARRVCCLTMLCGWLACQALAAEETPPPGTAKPPSTNLFGIKPEGITSEEMRKALGLLQQAGQVAGRRGSLTFFRWSNTTPPKLTTLGLWGPQVTNEAFAQIATLPDLENVSLHETAIDDEGLQALARLPKLRTLTIAPITRYEKAGFGPPQWSYPFLSPVPDRPRITGRGLNSLQKFATLESLNVLDAKLEPHDLQILKAGPKLGSLALPNAIDAETVTHLRGCHRLSSLTLGHREVTASELTQLAAWKSLRKLTLVHAQLSNEALQALSKLDTVEELHLEDCGLTDERLQYLRGSAKLSQLGLERNEIKGEGLVHVAKLPLKELGLEFNNISDSTLHRLLQLTSLETLGLSYCTKITDAGIQSGQLQRMKGWKELRLRGLKQVTDSSLAELAKFGHLKHINLRETRVSWENIPKLKESLPQTDVFK